MRPTHEDMSNTAKLSQQALTDSARWFGDTVSITDVRFLSLALCGETGEVANLVKKIWRGSLSMHDEATRHALAMEVADTYTYLVLLAGALNLDLEKLYAAKRKVNERRFTEERRLREQRGRES